MRRAFGTLAALTWFVPALSFAQPVPPLLADLTVFGATPSERAVRPSASVGLTYSVQNLGPGPSNPANLCLHFSRGGGVGIGQTPWSTVGGVPPGGSFQVADGFTAPTEPGLYVGRIDIDCTAAVFETDETNNSTTFEIVVLGGELRLVTMTLPDGFVNRSYVAQLQAEGGAPPFRFSSHLLPPGLSFDTNGLLSGEPSEAGVFPVDVTVVDQRGSMVSERLSLTVHTDDGPVITSDLLPPGNVGKEYCEPSRVFLEASGGSPPFRWNAPSDTLPPGLSVAEDGSICGVPSAPGTISFGVQVTDSAGRSDRRIVRVQILLDPLRLDPPKLPAGKVGEPYVAQLRARGGKEPYRFERDGNLPLGVQLRSDGGFFGTPEVAGTFTLSLVVTDALGNADKAMATIVIAAAGAAGGKILEPPSPPGEAAAALVSARAGRRRCSSAWWSSGAGVAAQDRERWESRTIRSMRRLIQAKRHSW
jgi:hypothetical protein